MSLLLAGQPARVRSEESREPDSQTQRAVAMVEPADGGGACRMFDNSPGECVEERRCEAVMAGRIFPRICSRGGLVGVCCDTGTGKTVLNLLNIT